MYSQALSTSEYGQYSLINSILALATIIVYFGMESAVSLWYYKAKDEKGKNKVFANWICFLFGISTLVSLVLYFGSTFLSRLIFDDTSSAVLIKLLAVNNLFFGLQYILIVWFRYQRKPWSAVIVAITVTVLSLLSNYYFVVAGGLGIDGILYSNIVVSVVTFAIGCVMLRRCLKFNLIDSSLMKSMLKFASPLVPAGIFRFLLMYSIIYFIEYFMSKSQLGIYQVGATLSGLIRLFILAFMIPWNTIWYNISKEDNSGLIYRNVATIFISIGLLAAIFTALFAPQLISLFSTSKYSSATTVMGLLAINHILIGMSQITLVGAALKKNNKPYLYAVMFGILITYLSFIVFIPVLGLRGACYAMLAGSIAVQASIFYQVNKIHFIPYDYTSIVLITISSILIEGINFYLIEGSQNSLIYKSILVITLISVIVILLKPLIVSFIHSSQKIKKVS